MRWKFYNKVINTRLNSYSICNVQLKQCNTNNAITKLVEKKDGDNSIEETFFTFRKLLLQDLNINSGDNL